MSTLRILGAAAAALIASSALAGTAAAKDGFYVAPSLGWIIPGTVDIVDGTTRAEGDYDNGWAFYAAAGYRFGQFRVEGELGYGELGGGEISVGNTDISFDANQSIFTGTLAGYVDFDAGAITPYVGAGLGFATSDVEDVRVAGFDLSDLEGSDTNFLMFGEAGLSYALSDTVSIVPSYRYVWTNDGGDGVDDSTAHVLRVGLRYGF